MWSINKSLLKIILDLFLVIPFISILFTVLIVSQELENGIVSGKDFWFIFVMGLVSLVSFGLIINRRIINQFTILDGIIFMFGIISILFSLFFHKSELFTKQFLLLLVIILYFYFRLILQEKKAFCALTICFILTGLIEAIWGLRQLYGFEKSQHYLFKLTGSFFNPGPYACYLAVVFPMALFYALRYSVCYKVKFHFRNVMVYLLWGISILTVITSIIVLPSSMSRTAWMSVVCGCGIVLFYF